MTDVARYPNSISIPLVPTGCLTAEFDSTYRIQLIGILSLDEFQESMKKINQAFSVPICLVVSASRMDTSAPFTIDVSFGFAIVLFILCVISVPILIFIVRIGLKRVQEVTSKESLKYHSRLPTPCYWRLDIATYSYARRYDNDRSQHRKVVQIGPSVPSVHSNPIDYSNEVVSVPAVSFERQDVNDLPPYPHSDTICCSQCSVPRRDSTAKFCSSCGQSFDGY